VEVHLAAAQLFERSDIRAGHDMNFIVGNLRDVDELILEIAELAAAPKMAEDVADRESEIDLAQEANVTNVLDRTLADHRQDSQLVSVIEHRGEITAVGREDEVWGSGHERERVGIHALGNCPQVGARSEADAAALGAGARDRLLLGLRSSIK